MSNQNIDKGVIKGMTHVQSPRYVRRRDQDAEVFLIVSICRGEEVLFFPHFIELLFYLRRVKTVIHSIDSLCKMAEITLVGSRHLMFSLPIDSIDDAATGSPDRGRIYSALFLLTLYFAR